MILRAKAALDNKAKAELMLLKVRAPCAAHRARCARLLLILGAV
jgi:hypothetical protein